MALNGPAFTPPPVNGLAISGGAFLRLPGEKLYIYLTLDYKQYEVIRISFRTQFALDKKAVLN